MNDNFKETAMRIKKQLEEECNTVENPTIIPNSTSMLQKTWMTTIHICFYMDPVDKAPRSECEESFRLKSIYISEIIRVLNEDIDFKAANLSLDGMFISASYNTPYKNDVYQVFEKAAKINTFKKMIQKRKNSIKHIELKFGIGINTNFEIITFTEQGYIVLPEQSVMKSRKLSEIGTISGDYPVAISENVYSNIIEIMEKENSSARNWFTPHDDYDAGKYYTSSIIKNKLNNAINEIMA